MFWSDGRGRREKQEGVLNASTAIASQEHRVHIRGEADVDPHAKGNGRLTNLAELSTQVEAGRS